MHKKTIAAVMLAAMMVTGGSVLADSEADYIILLPKKDGVEYTLDESHVSDQYSTDDYTVMLYKPGEEVSFTVDSSNVFSIESTIGDTATDYAQGTKDGKVSFSMPEEDISLLFHTEEVSSDETEPSTENMETSNASDTDNSETASSGKSGMVIRLHGNMTAEADMVGGGTESFESELDANKNVDIMTLYSDDGFSQKPDITITKNGEKMNDISGVVINRGGTKQYRVDFKNALDTNENEYIVDITAAGYTETEAAESEAAESEASTESEVSTKTEADAETETEKISEKITEESTEAVTEPATEAAEEAKSNTASASVNSFYESSAVSDQTEVRNNTSFKAVVFYSDGTVSVMNNVFSTKKEISGIELTGDFSGNTVEPEETEPGVYSSTLTFGISAENITVTAKKNGTEYPDTIRKYVLENGHLYLELQQAGGCTVSIEEQ